MGVSRDDCPIFLGTPYYLSLFSGTGNATHFKFGQYIQRVQAAELCIVDHRGSRRLRRLGYKSGPQGQHKFLATPMGYPVFFWSTADLPSQKNLAPPLFHLCR